MKQKNWNIVLGTALVAPWGLSANAQTVSYEANALPQNSVPQWSKVLDSTGGAGESVSGGILTTTTTAPTQSLAYRLMSSTGGWNPTATGSIIDVRMKVISQAAGAGRVCSFLIGTGTQAWLVRWGTTVISEELYGGVFAFDTTNAFHTYRFGVAGTEGPLNIYVDGDTSPIMTFAGLDSTAKRLDFGDQLDGDAGTAQWDYIRWGITPSPPTWIHDWSGDWNAAANWGGTVPSGADAEADFLGAITSPRTVVANAPVTVGKMRFDNANAYQISGLGSLTLAVASGSAQVNVQQGNHKINLPSFFASNTTITVASGSTLTIGDPMTIRANKTVTKTGALQIQAPLILESGASLVLGGGASAILGAPSMAPGAKVDVKNSTLSVNYSGLESAAATIQAQLASGYNGGAWDGPGVSTSSATSATGLGWNDDATNQLVLVKYTWNGDANLDGQVDITDLGSLASAWQTSNTWAGGDSNYDGFVDITDLGMLATNWQQGGGNLPGSGFDEAMASVGLSGVTVPEPAALSLASLTALGLRRRRRLVALGVAALALGGTRAKAQSFPYTSSYEANYLPQSPQTSPQWIKALDSDPAGPNTSESVSNGILTLFTASRADYLEYQMPGGSGLNWSPSGLGSTLEVRLKTDFNTSGASLAGDLVIATGNRGWVLGIGEGVISDLNTGGSYAINTKDAFRTLRFTTPDEVNGPLVMYVDGGAAPAKFWPGVTSTANRISFGDTTNSNEGGQIQWDYLRWTNQGKFAPVAPPPKAGEAGFGRQWLRERPLTVMGEWINTTPGGYQVTPFDMNEYLGMNMNTVFSFVSTEATAAAARAGVDWQMAANIAPGVPLTQEHKYAINNAISRGHAAGWYLPDEPQSQTDLRYAAEYARWMNANHPELPLTSNVYRTDISFLNSVVETVRPDLLSFDYYPFSSSGSTDANGWFGALMNVRQVSQAHQIMYGGWLQSFHLSGWNIRTPSESDTRYNGYTLLTAGYTTLNYYVYDNGPSTTVASTFLDSNGNPTAVYYYTATANKEYATIGKSLRFLTSSDVRFVPGSHTVSGSITAPNSTPSGLTNWAAGAGGDPHLTSVAVSSGQVGLEKDGLIGFFYDDDGQNYFMLTNLYHGASLSAAAASLSFSLTFDSTINEVLRLNRTTGAEELLPLTNHQLTWTLPGGTGDLFKYNVGDFIGYGWCMDASGDWLKADNWSEAVPNAIDAKAVFARTISAPRTIYADSPVTVATLRFANANTVQITGNGSLTIAVSSGTGSIAVTAGSHNINLPLIFASNTNISVAAGAGLTIGDPVTIKANKTVTMNGTLLMQAPLTIEAGGALILASGPTQLFGAPSLGAASRIDVKNTSVTIDYRGQASPASSIKTQLTSGYAAGAWSGAGIDTSSAIAGRTALGWKEDAVSQSILVKYTYYGDANLDGQVDISDLGALATAWQTSAVWSQGDFDYSGFVDISDLGKLATNWQLGVGSPLGPSFDEALASVGLAGVSVPEPAMFLIAACAGLLQRRRSVDVQTNSGHSKR